MHARNVVNLERLRPPSEVSYHDVATSRTGQSADTPLSTVHTPAVWPVTGRVPRGRASASAGQDGHGDHRYPRSSSIAYTEYVAGMIHAVRAALPLCVPNEVTGVGGVPYFARGAANTAHHQAGHSGVAIGCSYPVSNDQLLTTERTSYAAEFELPQGLLIKTFAPAIFMRILEWGGGTPDGFLEDWCNALHDLGTEETRGKSRATFLQSADRRYIIKTLNYGEFSTLRNVLPSYYTYLMNNPNSMLNHHLGLFRIARHKEVRYFTVMLNLLPPTVKFSAIYDLKGSTFKRAASAHDKASNPPLLKDNDFLDIGEKLSVSVIDQQLILGQLEADVAWLQSKHVMDYSFLVGKVNLAASNPAGSGPNVTSPPTTGRTQGTQGGHGTPSPSFQTACASELMASGAHALTQVGGSTVIRNAHSQIAFYVGIIDFLQDFNMKKQLAHTLKTTVGGAEKDALSTIPPDDYGNRFLSFVSKSFANQRRTTSSFFLDPYQVSSKQQSRLHRDDAIAVGDVVGRTFNEALTLDVMSPNVRSLCVVSEVRIPNTHSNAALLEQSLGASGGGGHGYGNGHGHGGGGGGEASSGSHNNSNNITATTHTSTATAATVVSGVGGLPVSAAVAAATAVRIGMNTPRGGAGESGGADGDPAAPQPSPRPRVVVKPLVGLQEAVARARANQQTYNGNNANLSPREYYDPQPPPVPVPISHALPPVSPRGGGGGGGPWDTDGRGSDDDDDEDDRLLLYICHTGPNVPVNVKGPVARGDMLVPSGNSDGTAVAVPRSCPVPPYCIGVVESVPPSVPEPDRAATKFTVVRAAVGEPLMVDPYIRWQKMVMVPLHTSVDTTQAMWVDATDEERTMLTRSAVLNPFGTSLIKGSWQSGLGWLVVDWMGGCMTHGVSAAPIPLRSQDGVIYEYMTREVQRRRRKLMEHLEYYVNQGLQGNLLKDLPAMEGVQATTSSFAVPPNAKAGEDDAQTALVMTPRSAANAERSNRSLSNFLKDWFSEPKGDAAGGVSSQHAQQLARQRYKANMLCSVSALLKTKGLFRRILLFLTLPDLNAVSRTCVQWNRQFHTTELWAYLAQIYHLPEDAATPDAMRASYQHLLPRREMTFSIGEWWQEAFGLRYPPYGTSKARLLEINTQLDMYDLIFRKHLPPHRAVLDFCLFKREQNIGADVTTADHTWDMDRAVQVFWPHLRNQWLRSSVTLKFVPTVPDQTTQDLAFMRLLVERWIGNLPVKLGWEGAVLLGTFRSLAVTDELLGRYEAAKDATGCAADELGFSVSRYVEMKLCRKVVPWREARKRIWAAFPGASTALKPVNKSALPFPPKVQEEYGAAAYEAVELRQVLTRCFERHLFPVDNGGCVGGVPQPGDAPGARFVEVYEVQDANAVQLPGQVFPHFLVGSAGVVGLMEANSRLPELTPETAAQHALGHLCIDTHSGLELHVLCAMSQVKCNEVTLKRLLLALDVIVHGKGTATSTYSIAVDGQGMPGGSVYTSPFWVCDALKDMADDVFDVLRGRKESLDVLRQRDQELLQRCFSQDITSIPGHAGAGSPFPSPSRMHTSLRQASLVTASNASIATIRRIPAAQSSCDGHTYANDSINSFPRSFIESPVPSNMSFATPERDRNQERAADAPPPYPGPVPYPSYVAE